MYEESVRALRRCSYISVADYDRQSDYCEPCPYFKSDTDITCIDMMMIDAADALESSDKNCAYLGDRVAELIAENEELKQEVERLKPFEEYVNKQIECVREHMKAVLDSIRYDGDPNIKVFKETVDEG